MTFANYELLEKISSSASGNVFRAKEPLMGRNVLVKMMPEAAKTHEEVLKRFQREIHLAAKLTHPNLVAAYHAGCHEGTYFLVMENIEGTDLAKKVKQDGPLEVTDAVDYVCQAAKGLAYLHRQGVVHRNVKPANLLLDNEGTVHVTNMTLAMVVAESQLAAEEIEELTRQGQMLGTSDYCAPEQAADAHSATERSDIYSLGCTFYYLLTGHPPYPAKGAKEKFAAHLRSPIPSLREARSEVSEKMDAVFRRMLAKVPGERYASMEEVGVDLQDALYGGRELASRRDAFRWELLALVGLACLITGGLVGAVLSML